MSADPSPIDQLITALTASLAGGTFVKLTLSKRRRDAAAEAEQAFCRLVEIRKRPHLSVLFRHPRKDLTHNWPVHEAGAVVREQLTTQFLNAHLFTTGGDYELRTSKKGEPHLARHAPSFKEAGPSTHDRSKAYVLDPATAPYLKELGIVSQTGHVRSDKADKYKQLQNLVKLLDAQVRASALHERARLRVVDMGCGKAYLTFALYDYFNHYLGVPTEVVGADLNAELVQTCNQIAQGLGYGGLSFVCRSVQDVELGELDVLVALHACDVATDEALYRGVEAGASVLMVVPCCQKELRPQLRLPPEERPLLKHDTFKDRYAQMLTDGVRGLLLESRGYRTKVIEFISDAHTHRNVMILGVLDPHFPAAEARLGEAVALLGRYGVQQQRLAGLLAGTASVQPTLDLDQEAVAAAEGLSAPS
jgi:SAM-dependent methyltransferase